MYESMSSAVPSSDVHVENVVERDDDWWFLARHVDCVVRADDLGVGSFEVPRKRKSSVSPLPGRWYLVGGVIR